MIQREYHKIETLFERDITGSKKLLPGQYRNETVEFLKDAQWDWTEKVDGTNMRVFWDGHTVSFAGRTERANIPVELANRMTKLFGGEDTAQIFEQLFGDKELTLYGEGYGRKIQNGGAYIKDGVDFILFDVMVYNGFMPRFYVEHVATALGIKVVPIVGSGTLDEAVAFIKTHPHSVLGDCTMEGIVARPHVEVKDRFGDRVIVKIKCRDFERSDDWGSR